MLKSPPTAQLVEVPNEGIVSLIGQKVALFCLNYIYSGKLEGVNGTCVKLVDAAIVYETGALTDAKWKDAQPLPHPLYVQFQCIESFTLGK